MPDVLDTLRAALGERYTVERELGRGGMATVYLAHDLKHDRPIALKVLHPELAAAVGAERFVREVRLTARLQHPHILPLYDSGAAPRQASDGTLLWYTMPYVAGESLRHRLAREGPLPVAHAVRVLRDVVKALAYAHRHGVVHRDVKPENVLLSEDAALVADFGVAKALSAAVTSPGSVTATSVVVGTLLYMAPEQAAGDPTVDHRADLYALGVLAYELLAGRTPFSGRSPQQVLVAQATEAPEPVTRVRADVPPALGALVMRCLEKEPSRRPQAAEEVLGELESFATPSGAATTAYAPGGDAARPRESRWLGRALAVGGVVAVLALVAYGAWSRANGRDADGRPTSAAAEARGAPRSVAVLPFANIGGDSATEYLSDGISDELATALGKVEGLRVLSALSLKGPGRDAPDVGRRLGVESVLRGSVRRAGNRLRVTARLTNTNDGFQLWAETYEREMKDVFAVQDEIARDIAGALRGRLAAGGTASLVSQQTADLAAYDLYLQGRFLWSQRTGDALTKAISFFERAIERDRSYAAAYAGLAEAYVVLPLYAAYPPSDAFRKATAAAESALALDSTLAGARATLGSVRVAMRDWSSAEAEFQHAIRLNPRDATAHSWYATLLGRVLRRDEEALREIRLAVQLDPLSRTNRTDLAMLRYFQRRYDDAVDELRQVLELDPGFAAAHQLLGRIHLHQGRHAAAVEELERSVGIGQRQISRAALAYAYAAAGHRDRAAAILDDFTGQSAGPYVSPFAIALTHVGLGRKDDAFAWLERAAETHDPYLAINHREPLLDPLRADTRFVRLLSRLGVEP